MPAGTCDPASRDAEFNETELETDGIKIYCRYGWDGVSTRETGCDGPVSLLRASNSNEDTWYVHFQSTSGTWRSITLAADETREIVEPELTQLGMDSFSDIRGFYVSDDSTPPANTLFRKK